jgi:hypothetical protein
MNSPPALFAKMGEFVYLQGAFSQALNERQGLNPTLQG